MGLLNNFYSPARKNSFTSAISVLDPTSCPLYDGPVNILQVLFVHGVFYAGVLEFGPCVIIKFFKKIIQVAVKRSEPLFSNNGNTEVYQVGETAVGNQNVVFFLQITMCHTGGMNSLDQQEHAFKKMLPVHYRCVAHRDPIDMLKNQELLLNKAVTGWNSFDAGQSPVDMVFVPEHPSPNQFCHPPPGCGLDYQVSAMPIVAVSMALIAVTEDVFPFFDRGIHPFS